MSDGTINNMQKITKNINSEDFFHNIWQFRETMLICDRPQKLSNGLCKSLWVPYMCLTSFVCELEIKYIYFLENNTLFKKGHTLETLYNDALSKSFKDKVEKTFSNLNSNFKQLLHDYSNVFEQWRYKYEFNTIDTIDKSFLKPFELILYEEVIRLRKIQS